MFNHEPFKCILDRVMVRLLDVDKSKDGEIVVGSKYRQKSNKGEVVSIGDFVVVGRQRIPVRDIVNVGDIVLFGEYNAELFKKDGEDFYLVRVQDVRGVEKLIKEKI